MRLVVKELPKSAVSSIAYKQEQKCLRLLNQLHHHNIIQFLGSYCYKENQNFIFPRIDMDLRAFLKEKQRFGNFRDNFTFFSALRGVASALLNTHNLHLNRQIHGIDFEGIGYHHDLRPANILVNKETFILADFGLGNVKSATSNSLTNWIQTSGDYLAPECMDEKTFQSQNTGRSIDIWAMGCLMADVTTYMSKGSEGVKDFRDKRLTERMPGFRDSCFYDSSGTTKIEITEWLRGLELSNVRAGPSSIVLLADLALRTLTSDPLQRMKIGELLNKLTRLSLQAHFSAVSTRFAIFVDSQPQADLDLQLLQTRLYTWGYVSELVKKPEDFLEAQMEWQDRIHDDAVKNLIHLFHALDSDGPWNFSLDSVRGDEIGRYVASLWRTLPQDLYKRATDYWQHEVLKSSDVDRIDAIAKASSSLRFSAFHDARALATMAQIRIAIDNLGLSNNDNTSHSWLMKGQDITTTDDSRPWVIGKWKPNTHVLVEWMWYALGWDKVDLSQRSVVMELRAKSFGLHQKPSSLRTLDCVGCFEKRGPKSGFGFVYRLPEHTRPEPKDLFQLLEDGEQHAANQPLLGDKFSLAAAVADFLKQFHIVGWVHESFNPHNIIFFSSQEGSAHSKSPDLKSPYFVGLHRSRPSGSIWQTEGPEAAGASDYHHPDYMINGRYRPEYDYYSLGIVLLEIGLWRTLKEMLSGDKFKTMSAAQIRQELIKLCKTRLGAKMGVVYRDTALRCLDGRLDIVRRQRVPESLRGEELNMGSFGEFLESVVEPLQRLAAASI